MPCELYTNKVIFIKKERVREGREGERKEGRK
jgi:hypothetical protein